MTYRYLSCDNPSLQHSEASNLLHVKDDRVWQTEWQEGCGEGRARTLLCGGQLACELTNTRGAHGESGADRMP